MRKPIIAATLAATMLLAGCGKGTNIPKKYKGFFDYTFGGNYTAEEITDANYGDRVWNISYTDVYGNSRTTKLIWNKPDDERMKDIHGSQDIADNYQDIADNYNMYYDFAAMCVSEIAGADFYERFVADKFDFDFDPQDGWLSNNDKGERLLLAALPPRFGLTDKENEYMAQQLSPEDGIKISEYDLKQTAQNPAFVFDCSITVDSSADPQECTEKMERIYEEFLAYTETPQNYRFSLKQRKDVDGNETVKLYSKVVMLGEEIDEEAMKEADSSYEFRYELERRLFGEEN